MTYSEHELEFTFANKIGLRLTVSVPVSVRLRALSRSHFLIDFHQNWHRRKNPKKNEFVRGSISHHLFLYFDPKKTILGQQVLKTHANIK